MTPDTTNYHPKGGMCLTCQHARRDCSHLMFSKMPVIERYNLVARVRCTGYARAPITQELADAHQ